MDEKSYLEEVEWMGKILDSKEWNAGARSCAHKWISQWISSGTYNGDLSMVSDSFELSLIPGGEPFESVPAHEGKVVCFYSRSFCFKPK